MSQMLHGCHEDKGNIAVLKNGNQRKASTCNE